MLYGFGLFIVAFGTLYIAPLFFFPYITVPEYCGGVIVQRDALIHTVYVAPRIHFGDTKQTTLTSFPFLSPIDVQWYKYPMGSGQSDYIFVVPTECVRGYGTEVCFFDDQVLTIGFSRLANRKKIDIQKKMFAPNVQEIAESLRYNRPDLCDTLEDLPAYISFDRNDCLYEQVMLRYTFDKGQCEKIDKDHWAYGACRSRMKLPAPEGRGISSL